ncbi:MAG: endolytic transglycosylase MltG [Parvularculales bacterium]
MKKQLGDLTSSRLFRQIGFILGVFFLIYVGTQSLCAIWHWPGPHEKSVVVVVPKGAGLDQIIEILNKAGVLMSPLAFRLGVGLTDFSNFLKAGEYRIQSWMSMADIAAQLRAGRSLQRRLTIPEGLTVQQIVKLIDAQDGLEGEIDSLPAEGSLLPETYYFEYGTTRQQIVMRIAAAHDKIMEELWPHRAKDLPFKTPDEAVILASIVDKETALAREKPVVAGVFINRLRRRMRLQSDPTVIYGLTDGFGILGRRIRQGELKKDTPYNTYIIYGLPPTPIANPSVDSIMAALHPEKTDYLYFVADGKGGHSFSRTLAEHNKQVRKWRRLREWKR